ncbi:MAG: ion transporter [Alphaproteobacteria bacterium]|nr:ion transporter [Alphaproteobacteria bacterium]
MPLEKRLHQMLAPEAWPGAGLSPLNRITCLLITIASVIAILETESTVRALTPAFFDGAEMVLGTIFTVEYVVRVYAAGGDPRYHGLVGRLRYIVSPLAIIDLLAIAPMLLTVVSTDTLLLRVCRLMRILRVAKLGRYSTATAHLLEAIRVRRYELTLSGALAAFTLIASASLMYIAEADAQPQAFGSIPRALWWSIATLTTVGYGDVYPMTVFGRILAGVTAIAAIGLIAMPTGILASAFSDVFQRERAAREQRGAARTATLEPSP